METKESEPPIQSQSASSSAGAFHHVVGLDPSFCETMGMDMDGMCLRHPNMMICSPSRVISICRICESEYQAGGVRQRRSFAKVNEQVQTLHQNKEEWGRFKGNWSGTAASSITSSVLVPQTLPEDHGDANISISANTTSEVDANSHINKSNINIRDDAQITKNTTVDANQIGDAKCASTFAQIIGQNNYSRQLILRAIQVQQWDQLDRNAEMEKMKQEIARLTTENKKQSRIIQLQQQQITSFKAAIGQNDQPISTNPKQSESIAEETSSNESRGISFSDGNQNLDAAEGIGTTNDTLGVFLSTEQTVAEAVNGIETPPILPSRKQSEAVLMTSTDENSVATESETTNASQQREEPPKLPIRQISELPVPSYPVSGKQQIDRYNEMQKNHLTATSNRGVSRKVSFNNRQNNTPPSLPQRHVSHDAHFSFISDITNASTLSSNLGGNTASLASLRDSSTFQTQQTNATSAFDSMSKEMSDYTIDTLSGEFKQKTCTTTIDEEDEEERLSSQTPSQLKNEQSQEISFIPEGHDDPSSLNNTSSQEISFNPNENFHAPAAGKEISFAPMAEENQNGPKEHSLSQEISFVPPGQRVASGPAEISFLPQSERTQSAFDPNRRKGTGRKNSQEIAFMMTNSEILNEEHQALDQEHFVPLPPGQNIMSPARSGRQYRHSTASRASTSASSNSSNPRRFKSSEEIQFHAGPDLNPSFRRKSIAEMQFNPNQQLLEDARRAMASPLVPTPVTSAKRKSLAAAAAAAQTAQIEPKKDIELISSTPPPSTDLERGITGEIRNKSQEEILEKIFGTAAMASTEDEQDDNYDDFEPIPSDLPVTLSGFLKINQRSSLNLSPVSCLTSGSYLMDPGMRDPDDDEDDDEDGPRKALQQAGFTKRLPLEEDFDSDEEDDDTVEAEDRSIPSKNDNKEIIVEETNKDNDVEHSTILSQHIQEDNTQEIQIQNPQPHKQQAVQRISNGSAQPLVPLKSTHPKQAAAISFPYTQSTVEVAGGRKSRSRAPKRTVHVDGETVQDKYGDGGLYIGMVAEEDRLPHGYGKMLYSNERQYDGEWKSGRWHGEGRWVNPNGDCYEGSFVYDARHGRGTYTWKNGNIYKGDFYEDKRQGKGTFNFANGNTYEGDFVNGVFQGFGRYSFDGGFYEGRWKSGRYHGDGFLLFADGSSYKGAFVDGVAHGQGEETSSDGIIRSGFWENGRPR